MVGLLGRVISPSQASTYTGQHNTERRGQNIHALSGIRTHDPSNQPAKNLASDRTATVTSTTTTTATATTTYYYYYHPIIYFNVLTQQLQEPITESEQQENKYKEQKT
jgi:hypothetical protein